MQLTDTTAMVTGAARGIGWEIAQGLFRAGSRVILVDLNREELLDSVEKIESSGSDWLIPVACDVSDPASVTEMFEKIKMDWGKLDILINNAGITRDNLFMRMKLAEWTKVIDVNLTGSYLCTRNAVSMLRKSPRGRIINISSVAAKGNPGQANYSASKAGIIGLTKTLALELARYGITANCIAPGFIETDMTRAIGDKARTDWMMKIPAGRAGQPADIAATILFLVSPGADYITGQVIGVDGGLGI
ncbi:beta-ketoacyl-ACP reductase [bacterium]|nr:beta-ketoacyl-ACP reductase [candidate division CSSED10-310 bacterium]